MAKTNEFEIYVEVNALAGAANTTLDMTDYVDVADNEAFEIHAVDIVLDPTAALPGPSEAIFQLADSNIQNFVSHSDRTSLYVARHTYDSTTVSMYQETSFSDITPLIVNKTLFCRSDLNGYLQSSGKGLHGSCTNSDRQRCLRWSTWLKWKEL